MPGQMLDVYFPNIEFGEQKTNYKILQITSGNQEIIKFEWTKSDLDKPINKEAAMAKLFASEIAMKICTEAIQIHGGYGYMREYPIARAWEDARVQRIYGGTNEIMKEIISRTLNK